MTLTATQIRPTGDRRAKQARGRFATALLGAAICFSLIVPDVAVAQSNNNDFTPLNSRIKRKQQFPTDLHRTWDPAKTTAVNKARSKMMMSQFTGCIYKRSKEGSVALLDKTDYGFVSFDQVDLSNERAVRVYGFNDCLRQVANANSTGVQLSFSAPAMRQWLIQEAYFDRYPEGPDWVKPGYVIEPRGYVMSEGNMAVHFVLDFADCVVAADPDGSDYYFRTPAGSQEEKQALQALIPTLGPCLPNGQQIEVTPVYLRTWLGEALWHAARNSAPADVSSSEVAQ